MSFIIFSNYHLHPLSTSSFLILILYHPYPLLSSSFIILILYHPYPLSSSNSFILIFIFIFIFLITIIIIIIINIKQDVLEGRLPGKILRLRQFPQRSPQTTKKNPRKLSKLEKQRCPKIYPYHIYSLSILCFIQLNLITFIWKIIGFERGKNIWIYYLLCFSSFEVNKFKHIILL